ncbi:cellulase family glycosylhydrolase [Paenibacillus sp. T3-5-0-4]|nr:cellulase family glycosylhydrolase [Paenibacillus endoradicis]
MSFPIAIVDPQDLEDLHYSKDMRNISAMDLVKDMKIGWNLGNTLDSFGGETRWGNPTTTKEMIDEIKNAGFQSVRIPITWDDNIGNEPDYIINAGYLDRAEEIVQYVLSNDMYAIINIHHHYGWEAVNVENKAAATDQLKKMWQQIAEHFKEYGDFLIFEAMNEPRNGDDWNGNAEAYEIVNGYNAAALETIRATGGNNEQRLVMLPTYAASANYDALVAFTIPDDKNIAISIHSYSPFEFSMEITRESEREWGSDQDKKSTSNLFELLETMFLSKGTPVVLGEFASTNKENLDARVTHASYFVKSAKQKGIPTFWWDNGYSDAFGTDAMALFNRRTLTWIYPEIMEAMVNVYNGKDPAFDEVSDSDSTILFEGEKSSNGEWGQAVTLSPRIDFMPYDLSKDIIIAVEYEGVNVPELILQSWSGGEPWAKVAPAEEVDRIAYFKFDDMALAYKDETFSNLNALLIGDTGAALKVFKVYFVN